MRLRADVLANRRFQRCDGAHGGLGLEGRAQAARVRAVVLVHPKAGEARLTGDDRELIRRFPAVNMLDQFVFFLVGRDYQRAAGLRDGVDGLKAVPCPGLHALAKRIVHADGDIHLLGLVLRSHGLELFFVVRDVAELLGRNPVSLGRIAVAPERDAWLSFFHGRENQGP